MNEIWKNIKGFEGLYQISNLGNVKCLEHKCPGRYKGHYRTVKEHLMSLTTNKNNGYKYVTLSNKDRGTTHIVHRLVAEAFIPNPDNLPCVNHKDENKQNNCVDNLEWCTNLYNNTYNDVQLKRKKYVHKYEYELDKIKNNIRDLKESINIFRNKFPEINIDDMIKELLSQKNYGKQEA